MTKQPSLLNRIRRTQEQRKNELRESTTIGDPLPTTAVALKVKGPEYGLRIAVVGDAQVKPGVPINHLVAYGKYIAAKQPDVILCIGDFADLQSLSTYDQPGSIDAEGQRYRNDVGAVRAAMEAFLTPISKVAGYKPEMIFTEGNHEERIEKAIRSDPRRLMGVINKRDLGYEQLGWKVIPFLQPVTINEVAFCHFFPTGVMGKPVSTPRMLLQKLHMSAYAGHQQGRDIAFSRRADGREITAIISGSFYQHDEKYLSPFTNRHWRGTYFLNEVKDGSFDAMELSVNYLLRRYA